MIPEAITVILSNHGSLGFKWVKEAADFVLANRDWAALIKEDYSDDELQQLNKWREDTIANRKKISEMR